MVKIKLEDLLIQTPRDAKEIPTIHVESSTRGIWIGRFEFSRNGRKLYDHVFVDEDGALGYSIWIDDPNIPINQGEIRREGANVVFYNQCVHGTLVALSKGREVIVQGYDPDRGDIPLSIGDRIYLGFPRSPHRFRIVLSE